jgi:hypothetical protein
MIELIVPGGVLLLLLVVGAKAYSMERRQRREALLRWAASQGYRIIDYRQPILTEMSPFPMVASKAQQVFRFTIEHPDGTHQSGWVLLGSAWGGLKSEKAEVRWNA